MTRPRWRIGALAASVAMPAVLIGLTPAAGQACCDDREDEVVVSINGTICWEQPPKEGTRTAPTDNRGPTGKDGRPAVVVYLSQPVKEPVTVIFSTEDGTAVAPDDYEAVKELEVTIPAGARGVEVPLGIRADDKREPDEWFAVTIEKPSVGTIKEGRAEVVIKDGAPPRDEGR